MTPDGTDHRQVTKVDQDQDYPENDYIQTMGLRWSPDGGRLLYFTNRDGNLDLMIVDVAIGARRRPSMRPTARIIRSAGWTIARSRTCTRTTARRPISTSAPSAAQARAAAPSRAGRCIVPRTSIASSGCRGRVADGVTVSGFLRRPSARPAGARLPALVMSHTYNVGQFYNQWNPIFSYIVQSGYVMLTVDHRGSNGYGVTFRDLPKGNWGFAQLTDLVSAAGYLRALPDVDPDRASA